MKQTWMRWLCALLAAVMMMIMIGCNSDPEGNGDGDGSTPPAPDTEATGTGGDDSATDSGTDSETDGGNTPVASGYNLNEYTLICAYNATDTVREDMVKFFDKIKSYAQSIKMGDDWIAEGQEENVKAAKELIYGAADRDESRALIEALPEDKDYAIGFYANKIVLYGLTSQSLKLAVDDFMTNYVKKSAEGVLPEVEAGTVLYGVDPEMNVTLSYKSFVDYPKFRRAHSDSHLCAYYGDQFLYSDVKASAIDEYASRLVAAGFEQTQDNKGNGNRALTFLGEEGRIHLFYRSSDRSLVVSADNGVNTPFRKPAEGSWEKLTKNSFAVMTMDYSKYSCSVGCLPRYDNNGLSYVITLEDGRYIVYDGGYAAPNDAQILYEYMYDNNVREGLPVIAAWVFTHSHADHFGAFQSFSSKHANDVILEEVVMNTGRSDCYDGGGHDMTLEQLGAFVKTKYGVESVIQLHVGQSLYFGSVEIEALYTHETFHFDNRKLGDENTASFVTRVWIDGVSILLLGDAADATCLGLRDLYGDYVKSDFMQIAHHGNGGGRRELYTLVDPDYMLWTTSQPGFRRRTNGTAYSVGMPSNYIAKLNKQMFEHVGGVRETIDANGAYNAEGVQTNWCADGPVDILTFGENKTVNVSYYEIREELLPNNPIEEWNAEFLPDNR